MLSLPLIPSCAWFSFPVGDTPPLLLRTPYIHYKFDHHICCAPRSFRYTNSSVPRFRLRLDIIATTESTVVLSTKHSTTRLLVNRVQIIKKDSSPATAGISPPAQRLLVPSPCPPYHISHSRAYKCCGAARRLGLQVIVAQGKLSVSQGHKISFVTFVTHPRVEH